MRLETPRPGRILGRRHRASRGQPLLVTRVAARRAIPALVCLVTPAVPAPPHLAIPVPLRLVIPGRPRPRIPAPRPTAAGPATNPVRLPSRSRPRSVPATPHRAEGTRARTVTCVIRVIRVIRATILAVGAAGHPNVTPTVSRSIPVVSAVAGARAPREHRSPRQPHVANDRPACPVGAGSAR